MMLVPSKTMARPVRRPSRKTAPADLDPRRTLDPDMRELLRRLDDVPFPKIT